MNRPTCPACGADNEPGAEACANCGEPLSTVGRIFGHASKPSDPRWLSAARDRAQALKEEGVRGSEERMQVFLDIDRRRESAQAEAAARQRQRDAKLLRGAAVTLVVFLVIVAIVTLGSLFP